MELKEDTREKILIADGNKDFLSVMQSVLEFAGFSVETAEDGEDALDHIRKLHYDLLVLGVVMPRVDGIRLLHIVRTSKEYASVPVIFIAAASDKKGPDSQLKKTIYKGEGHIRMPFKNKAFLEMVTALLEKKREFGAQYN